MTRSTNRRRGTVGGALLLTLATLGLSGVLAPAARASTTLGPVTVSPSSGTVDDSLTLRTSRGCPAAAKMSKSRISGPGFPVHGQNMSGAAPGFTSATKPFDVEAGFTLKDVSALAYPPVTYKGTYRVEVICINNNGEDIGHFASTITFSNVLQWAATTPSKPVKPGPTASLPSLSPTPAPSSTSTTSPSATPSGSASTSQNAAVSPNAPSPSDTGSADTVAADAAASTSSTSWLPIAIGVLAGAGVAVGAMALLQRRQASTGSRAS
jgi:hypothetical protein